MTSARWRLLAMLMICLGLASCGDGRKRLYPVSGVILVDGKAAKDCFIFFFPADPNSPEAKNRTIPRGQTDEQGKFVMSTYEHGDGAPAESFIVTFSWKEASGILKNQFEGPDKLNGRYSDPNTSTFKLTMKPEPTVLEPYKLTTK